MKLFLSLLLVMTWTVIEIQACHNPLHGLSYYRRKRSTDTLSSDYSGHDISSLIDYFTSCMINRKGDSFDWYSSTVWTINDSNWYYYTDNLDCADEDYDNETNCWILNVENLFDESLSFDVKECIEQFAIDNNFPVDTSAVKRRRKRTAPPPPNSPLPPRNSECPSIPPAYDTELKRLSPPRPGKPGKTFNIDNVATFVDLYTVCTECERYSGEDPVDCYANRLNQLTKLNSDIKQTIQVANSKYANGGKTVGNCRDNVYMTDWFDNPLTSDGDDQSLSLLQQQHPNSICQKPDGIQAELSASQKPFGRGNNSLTISPRHGLVCLDSNQTEGSCQNYRVRFCCKDYVGKCSPRSGWSSYFDVPGTTTTSSRSARIPSSFNVIRRQNRGRVCSNPTGVGARVSSGTPYQLSGDVVELSIEGGLTCDPSIQYDMTCEDYEIRYCCPSMIGTCAEGHQWTKWYKGESNTRGFDARLSVLKRKENWHCKSTPSAINVQLENSREPYIMGKNKFSWISPEKGVLCKNNQQSENIKCKKYRVSFCCTLK